MKIIVDKHVINLLNKNYVIFIPNEKIHINELFYEIEYDPKYNKIALFIEVIDGVEKSLQLNFDETGVKKGALNPQNIFASENFIVERITFNCFKTVEFTFTLTQVVEPSKVTA